jgi:hypothetical protein
MDDKEKIITLMKNECGECASHDGLETKNLIVICDQERCECLIAINKFKANNK